MENIRLMIRMKVNRTTPVAIKASRCKVVFVFHVPETTQYSVTAHHFVLVYRQEFQYLCLTCRKHLLAVVLLVFQRGMVGIKVYLPSFTSWLLFLLRLPSFSRIRLCMCASSSSGMKGFFT